MPFVNGWFLKELPSPERKRQAEVSARLLAKRTAELCGMCCQLSLYEKVLTVEEVTMLRESFRDDRNPGQVTMSQLFHCWLTGEDHDVVGPPAVAAPDVRGDGSGPAGTGRDPTHPCD